MEAAFSSTANFQPLSTTLASSLLNPGVATQATLRADSLLQPSQRASAATSLVFIDPGVSDYQSLLDGVQPGTEVHLLNAAQDAVDQITQTLLGRTGITSLHIVSHGQAGGLKLGNNWLSLANLRSYSGELQSWGNALTDDADILLYGCDVAQGAIGHAFVQQFAQLTGADIAASDNLTGSSALGGDWTLEVNTGAIAASLVFQASAIANYQHILPIDLISTVDSSIVSDTSSGTQFSGNMSDDGRYVTFSSTAVNLAPNDTNTTQDVFVRDLQTGTTVLVSANSSGTAGGNGASFRADISGNGRYVVFLSDASNLVANDNNNATDVFVRDLVTNTTTLVSVNSSGTGSGTVTGYLSNDSLRISSDGRYVTFTSNAKDLVANDNNNQLDVFRRDMVAGITTLVSGNSAHTGSGNGASSMPSMTSDGRYVIFASTASNLITNDTNGSIQDVFQWDSLSGITTLVSANSSGTGSGNGYSGDLNIRISKDGRYVAFNSNASNLVTNDTNGGLEDVFVRDVQAGITTLVSVNSTGTGSGNGASTAPPSFSSDGRYVAFVSFASNLVANDTNGSQQDVFVRDLQTGMTTLVSVNSTGTGSGDGFSGNNSTDGNFVRLSSDGHYIAFMSSASDLVANDTNGVSDIFVYDRLTGTTTLASHTSTDTSGNNASSAASLFSSNGRLVFLSTASDLVANDANGAADVFVYDTTTKTNTLVSQRDPALPSSASGSGSSSTSPNSVSADGRYIVFTSYASNLVPKDNNNNQDIFLRDRTTGITTLVSHTSTGSSGNGFSTKPTISSDGRFVVFSSNANNLVAGDVNGTYDVFLYDRTTGSLTLVSHTNAGSSGNYASDGAVISGDGRYVTFVSGASNLVANDTNGTITDVFVWDRQTNGLTLVSHTSTGNSGSGASDSPTISDDGRFVAFRSSASNLVATDSNGSTQDIFVWDRQTGTVSLVSHTSIGGSGNSYSYNPVLSSNGNYVAFVSNASNLTTGDSNGTVDVFLWERQTGNVILASRTSTGSSGNSSSDLPVISTDGRFVSFSSSAYNLSANDTNGTTTDVYVYDRQSNSVRLVSHTSAGSSSNSYATNSVMSGDGRYIAFSSTATNLVANDSNGSNIDVFVWDRQTDNVRLVSYGSKSGTSDSPVISSSGNYITFNSFANDFVANDYNTSVDVYGFSLTPPTVSINNVSRAETNNGTTAYTFIVSLSKATDQLISVNYATADGTATVADNDYTAVSGVLTFNPGETSKTITVNVKGDTKVEQDETFLMKLLNPTNATLALNADTGIGTIVNDDHAQLLWRNSVSGQNAVWQLNGLTVQSSYYLPPVVDANWQMVSTADFNHDGIADILWRNQLTGANGIWQMNSTGYQTSSYITAVADTNWQIVSTADFNKDGTPDLLWRNVKTGENAIWQMNGFVVQPTAYINPVADTNWQIVSTADFNRDGIADLLWRNVKTGENAIWQMHGFTVQTTAYINPVADVNWQLVSTADCNGDGIAVLVWRNSRTGENAIWQMQGFVVQTTAYINPVGDTNWQLVGTTDCNGDGIADLLWRNSRTGEDSIWQMQGFMVQTTAYINPVADTNWRVKPFVSASILTSA